MEALFPLVLVTEVTRGAGYEISKLFARSKYRMIIVGNEAATLHNVSEILKTLGAPTVHSICIDLSQESSAEEILKEVTKLGLPVSTVVNCIGGHYSQLFAEDPIRRQSMIIHHNVVSIVKLTSLFLDRMRWEGKGTIVQVFSNDSAKSAEPVEEGAQAFLNAFMEAVSREGRNQGIKLATHTLTTDHTGENAELLTETQKFFELFFMAQPTKQNASQKRKKIAA